MSNVNLKGKALDAWYAAMPDDTYAPCPCGCGTKWRFVMKNDDEYNKHEATFVNQYVEKHKDE